uniref:Asparagine synthetase domain-containing protein n=1 Tax=Theileria parva TaxID=5875 RepID=Q4N8Q9_THEPA|eukprot:XP_765932.1 hypothetical protein [Theileria parva strain Muguga]
MDGNEYIEAEFRVKDERFDASEIECKLAKFNEVALEHDSSINNSNDALYGNFSPGNQTQKLCINSVYDVLNFLSQFTGSFSLIYISLHTGRIYILKDDYGFKSLLVSFNTENKTVVISDKALNTNGKCYELPPFITLLFGKNLSMYLRPKSNIHKLTGKEFPQTLITDDLVNHVINNIHNELISSIKEICNVSGPKECVSILFSGGLDSTLISVITLSQTKFSYYQLINVCFKDSADVSEFGVAPDRITSLLSYEELVNLFPNLDIRLVLIDVSSEDYSRDEPEIFALTYPNNTHMDLNIGASLYYAGTLKGKLLSKEFFKSKDWSQMKSNISILKSINFKVTISKKNSVKSGVFMELDESQAESDSNINLSEFLSELNKYCTDIVRLWKRNFGRDDRVLNFRNLNALYPFLANNIVNSMLTLPFNPAVIVDFLDPPNWFKSLNIYRGIDANLLLNSEFLSNSSGKSVSIFINKWILREIAYMNGLRMCCNFKKRAIQFGTKSAKIFNRLHNMSNRHASNKGSNILHLYISS